MKHQTEFIRGFAAAIGKAPEEALQVWKDFSRGMPSGQTKRLESDGYNVGYAQGLAYKQWEGQDDA